MKIGRIKQTVVVLSLLLLFSAGTALAFAPLREGDLLPLENRMAIAKVGTMAPPLKLSFMEGSATEFVPGRVTLLLAPSRLEDVERLRQFDALQARWRNKINFAFVLRGGEAQIRIFWQQYGLTSPVGLQLHSEFFKQYNAGPPAFVIIDATGNIRYNGDWRVSMDSLDRAVEQLLAELPATRTDLALAFEPGKKVAEDKVPVLRRIGDRIEGDEFTGATGEPVHLDFRDKATVLFLWRNEMTVEAMDKMMELTRSLAAENNLGVAVYLVNGSRQEKKAQSLLAPYKSTVPLLRGGKFLQYARKFPSVVIIDKAGVLRARFEQLPDPGTIENVLSNIQGQ